MTTIIDVAKAAGLSTATVSRALSAPEKVAKETRARVMRAIEKVDYRPNMLARNLRSDRAFSLLVLVPGIANPFFANVTAGIESVAWQRGYSVFIGDTRDSREREEHYERSVEMRLADGVIQLSPDYGFDEQRRRASYPIVHACGCELTAAPSVRIDNAGAMREMAEHLIAAGHRRIAAISGPEQNPHAIDRLKGYREALELAGIGYDPAIVRHGDFSMGSGVEAAKDLMALTPRPTALLCMNDEMAIGAIQALAAVGLDVPGDVAVTGFDDISFAAHSTPALTTVAQPADAMGAKACELLIDEIEGKEVEEKVHVLPHRLVIRESSGPPR
ncbi:MAG: LacI family DNA-binding transcriptional regulator [Sphingomonas sp.]|uniref:LacI family DNA-binding transcriptional regulator n=1 Tax=Sphingomonas sp. TaxID=28214 RepID=UPI003F806B58